MKFVLDFFFLLFICVVRFYGSVLFRQRFREGNHHRLDRYPENYRAIIRLDGRVDCAWSSYVWLARYGHHYAFYYLANFTIVLTFPLL